MIHEYLRTHPNLWPIYSTKNYVRDADGWWNPVKSKRQLRKEREKKERENILNDV